LELLQQFVDFFLNLDEHLARVIQEYGKTTYAILFGIIFCETGLVVTPLLPGDSLLFAAGAFCEKGQLNIWVLFFLLWLAAFLGDTVNYWVGNFVGPKVFRQKKSWFFNPEHLKRAHAFYEKYGGKTIIIARFVPIVRTFAPFVAGVGSMTYPKFISYNIIGGALWVAICLGAGYFFGNMESVKANFESVIFAIIGLSLLPMVYEYFKHRMEAKGKKKR
jgi:membrane-associated protein